MHLMSTWGGGRRGARPSTSPASLQFAPIVREPLVPVRLFLLFRYDFAGCRFYRTRGVIHRKKMESYFWRFLLVNDESKPIKNDCLLTNFRAPLIKERHPSIK